VGIGKSVRVRAAPSVKHGASLRATASCADVYLVGLRPKSQMIHSDVTQTHLGIALIGYWRACNFMIGSTLFFSNTRPEW